MGFFEDAQLELEYLETLPKENKKAFRKLSKEEKKRIISEFKQEKYNTNSHYQQKMNTDKLNSFFEKRGIYNPSNILLNAADKNRIDVFSNKMGNMAGMLTLNLEKQMNYNHHMTQLSQNFVNTALLNRIVNQNDEIIELLKHISEVK